MPADDDDFCSLPDEDELTHCSICDKWINLEVEGNGDASFLCQEHEHVLTVALERCGLRCQYPDCDKNEDGEAEQCNHWRYHKGPCLCLEHMDSGKCACTRGCTQQSDHTEFCDQRGQCIGYDCGCVGGVLMPADGTGMHCHMCADSFQLEGHMNLTGAKLHDCDDFMLEPDD